LAAEQYLCYSTERNPTNVSHCSKLVNWLGKPNKLRAISVFGQRVCVQIQLSTQILTNRLADWALARAFPKTQTIE